MRRRQGLQRFALALSFALLLVEDLQAQQGLGAPTSPPPAFSCNSEANAQSAQSCPQSSGGTPTKAPAPLGQPAEGVLGFEPSKHAAGLRKLPFPLGVATAATQVEGAALIDGRGPSEWDALCAIPGLVKRDATPTVADDFYHKYMDDIATAKILGFKQFRFSISWSRVYPTGTGEINQAGLDFYSRLVDALLAAGLEPHVTVYHWDMPLALHEAYGSWLSPNSIQDFVNYAETVFRALGNRVTYWTTFNEMQTFITQGWGTGWMPPARCSNRTKCAEGDTDTEPWLVLHNVLIAHGKAVAILRSMWPHARVSCNFYTKGALPKHDTPEDKAAVQNYYDFHIGVYADPLFFGNFPASVLAAKIPGLSLTPDEQKLLNGTVDYFALNFYTTVYVTTWNNHKEEADKPMEMGVSDQMAAGNTATYSARSGVPIGPRSEYFWLYSYPPGMRDILKYIDTYYKHPIIYVTENGVDGPGESEMPMEQALNDTFRIDYLKGYIQAAADAVEKDGVDLRGYHVWSLFDNFEWRMGYEYRYGICRVDYENGQKRTAKESAKFLATWMKV